MSENLEHGEPAVEVVAVSEYGAATPAWIKLDTWRWMTRHWQFPLLMLALIGVFVFLMVKVVSGFLWLALFCGFLLWRNWNGVRHSFEHGNANPGRIVSVKPPLVAVWTDLDNRGEEEKAEAGGDPAIPQYPAVKVMPYPLKSVLGEPLEWGQPVATASIYEGSEKRPHWKGFNPVVLEEGCGKRDELLGVLGRIPESDWAELDAAVERLSAKGKLKPGLYPLFRQKS